MKITVLGAGAVGGYFGGRMLEAGLDVTFLVRENRAIQLRETGLEIQSSQGNAHIRNLKLVVSACEIDACDIVIVAVKNYHLNQAIEQIRCLVDKGANVLPLLNGVEHIEILQQAFGEKVVMGGLCQIISTLDRDGRILHNGSLHDMQIGALHPDQESLGRKLFDALQDANLRCLYKENITLEMWLKYAFITAFSAITTAARLKIHDVLATPATQAVFVQVLNEMQKLAKANQVPIPDNFAETTVHRMQLMPKGATSSMHQDLSKGLPLEVESLQGGALRLASRLGVEIPTIQILYGLIKPYEGAK